MAMRSDWGHFYTRDDVMKKASPLEKLKFMRKQLDDFAVLQQEVTSRFSEETFLSNIRQLDNKYNKRHFQYLEAITNLALFRQLLLRLRLDNDSNNTDDKAMLDYFVDILRLLDDVKRLNKYFTERVYTPLVEHFFPAQGMETAATALTGHAQAVTVLSKAGIKSQRKEVVQNGKTAQHTQTDEHSAKFLRTVTRLFKLQQRWSRLSLDGPISVVLFEAETVKSSEETDNSRPFYLIRHFVPDLVAKASKAVAITETWYALYVEMSDLPGNESMSRDQQIEEVRLKISKTSRNIDQLEKDLAGYQKELAGLTTRDARYNQLTKAFQTASVSSEELSSDISDLEETEKKIMRQLQEYAQRKEVRRYEELKQEAGQIQQKLQATRHNLELARYHSAVLRDDMEVLMAVLPSFHRFRDRVREKIDFAAAQLNNERKKQLKLEEKLQNLKRNSKPTNEKLSNETKSEEKLQEHLRSQAPSSNGKDTVTYPIGTILVSIDVYD